MDGPTEIAKAKVEEDLEVKERRKVKVEVDFVYQTIQVETKEEVQAKPEEKYDESTEVNGRKEIASESDAKEEESYDKI